MTHAADPTERLNAIGELGAPEDIAEPVVFLVSERARCDGVDNFRRPLCHGGGARQR
ncbi:MAG: hypothetical protein AVDCRST_MAG08-1148 [uncultured Acetobacteraceae bacterium]|uniref:Uncharacterized protein n=1 Tax=uncultured Acetobacteraceae bacterium TaxID=169975 RepID=A0A6J4HS02_9PROT|nr:MAG: hypothetical protein AVDCRST_MAG08-1148 [uncultured Acetobacteraceae bacterium]